MAIKAVVLILASVLLSAVAQILLKIGMVSAAARQALAESTIVGGYLSVLLTPMVIAGLSSYVLGALVWLRV